MTQAKDTIYIDVDDEITHIIDKVNASDSKIVALVLPKRATVLQSIVNMKLLKRSATNGKKNVVLITSEAGLLPLAGVVGLHVAKNLQSKPAIPAVPEGVKPAANDDDEALDTDPDLDDHKTVGELAGPSATRTPPKKALDDDTIELDDDVVSHSLTPPPKAAPPKKTAKKFKIPNFERFRLLVVLGGAGLIGLIVFLYFAIFVMPSATINIKTDSTTVNSNIAFTASTTAQALDPTKKIVPAKRQEVKKTDTEKAPATGQKDIGTKASGTVTITNCGANDVVIPAGTGFSSGNFTFISQTAAAVSKSSYDLTASGFVCRGDGQETLSVVAQNAGDSYNLSARDYKIANNPDKVTAKGSDMTGGTSQVVKVVSQADVDSAKQKLANRANQAATDELKTALKAAGMLPIDETFIPGDPAVTASPNVGEQGNEVTVSSVTTSSLLGVNEADLAKLIETDAKSQIDTSKQDILDNGLGDASYIINDSKRVRTQTPITIQAIVKAGPRLDAEGIKREVAGKKKSPTLKAIQARPGIKDVTVSYSPFWVSQTPKKLNKINIIFDKAQK